MLISLKCIFFLYFSAHSSGPLKLQEVFAQWCGAIKMTVCDETVKSDLYNQILIINGEKYIVL